VVQASVEGEDVRARIQSVEPLDEAIAQHQKGMRIYVRDETPLASIAERLKQRGEGEVSMVLILDSAHEVELRLPGRYLATPQIAGALRAVPGVVHVELQ